MGGELEREAFAPVTVVRLAVTVVGGPDGERRLELGGGLQRVDPHLHPKLKTRRSRFRLSERDSESSRQFRAAAGKKGARTNY